jgi:MFS family permease
MNQTNTTTASRLFNASCIALITTAMTFAFRAALEGTWGLEFSLSKEQLGWIFGPAFWGFTLAMLFGGPLVDILGMRLILLLAFVGHLSGITIYLFAQNAATLFVGTLMIGIGNGMVEAACNPLIVSLYPKNKTTMLNKFHVWFPGGIVVGGLVAYVAMDNFHADWRYLVALLYVPTIVYGIMFLGQKFPETERVSSGVSTADMFKACLNPLFLVMVICMLFTAATELGTNQWINALLAGSGVSGILILVFVNGLMAVGRMFAGPVVHRLNAAGMLIFSAAFSCLGLVMLSQTTGYFAFGSAFVFAIGICFFWPTMLGFVSEYTPKTGALGLSIMGGAGMFSVSLVLPKMGQLYDSQLASSLQDLAPAGTTLDQLREAVTGSSNFELWQQIQTAAGSGTLLQVAALPAFLLLAFSGVYFWVKGKRD